jgi:hypothetical protein
MWGTPRIQAELRLPGQEVAEATVAKYVLPPRYRKPPSQTWRTFLKNHVGTPASMGFSVVPTVTFRLLNVLNILCRYRRRVLHISITRAVTAEWVIRQLREAFPFETLRCVQKGVAAGYPSREVSHAWRRE